MIRVEVGLHCDGDGCRAFSSFSCRPADMQDNFTAKMDDGWTIRANKCFCVECGQAETNKARDQRLLHETPAQRDQRLLREEGGA